MARRRESSGRGSAANPQGGSFGERPIRAGEGSRRRDAARFGGFRPSQARVARLACLLLALPAAGCGSDGDAADGRPVELAPPRSERDGAREVFVVGDSLAAEMAGLLPAALPGWRVRIDAEWGRPLAEGMRILGEQRSLPAILAISLFTNDDPRDTEELETAVRATAARRGGCAVWSTIVAPPFVGVSHEAANALLRRLARDRALALELVDWERAVARDASLMSADEVHASPSGYRARARMYAAAIRACAEPSLGTRSG